MKYVRIIHIILLCLISNFIDAQNNHFFKENARWVYFTKESYEPGQIWVNSSIEEITIKGDTTIGSTNYKKVYRRFINTKTAFPPFPHPSTSTTSFSKEGPLFLRYDVANGKVFFKSKPDSAEYIIYDSTLKVGDTIPVKSYLENRNTILKIDTISIFGKIARIYITDTFNLSNKNGFLEGIGGINGFEKNKPVFHAISGGIEMTELVCFEYEGNTFSMPSISNLTCPSDEDFMTSTKEVSDYNIKQYPNPSDGNVSLQIPDELIGSTLSIYNLLGLEILNLKINQGFINLTLNESGTYMYILKKENKQINGGTFVVNK